MLKAINDLRPFFEDNYRRINVREYARIQKISTPTASNLLESYRKNRIVSMEKDRKYHFYFANKDNDIFIDLSRIYWKVAMEKIGLLKELEKQFLFPVLILFGSLAKAEAKKDSDIDIAVFSVSNKKIDFSFYEKKLRRKIQIFTFKNRDIAENNHELLNNILNGYKISGGW